MLHVSLIRWVSKVIVEDGAIASPRTIINTILDTLAPLGVTDIEMPATPERVLQAISGRSQLEKLQKLALTKTDQPTCV
jgi:hypothetical protein